MLRELYNFKYLGGGAGGGGELVLKILSYVFVTEI